MEGLNLVTRSRAVGFGSTLASGAAGAVPRPVGNLIQVDFDAIGGIEYFYALTNRGLARSVDGGQSWVVLGLSKAPSMAWAALCLASDGSLYAASFRTSTTSGSQVWRITSPRGAALISAVRNAPAVVEDLRAVGGQVFAACGSHGLYSNTPATWSAIAPSTFAGCHLSSVDGLGTTVYVGAATFPKNSQKCIAVSCDGGRSFRWATPASNVSQIVAGTGRR